MVNFMSGTDVYRRGNILVESSKMYFENKINQQSRIRQVYVIICLNTIS